MRTLIGLALIAVTALSQAQLVNVWAQPWNTATRLLGWQSVIISTATPTPAKRMCLDDFRLTAGANLKMISFYGWVSNPAQLVRPFRVSIHLPNPATGRPQAAPIWQYTGIMTTRVPVVPDLAGHMVYRFNLSIPPAIPLNLPMGDYWLGVAEDDSVSIRPGNVPDFFWSSFQPIRRNPAIAYNWNGTLNQPLIDTTNGMRDDLSFMLYR